MNVIARLEVTILYAAEVSSTLRAELTRISAQLAGLPRPAAE
jgi:hypothetical protein